MNKKSRAIIARSRASSNASRGNISDGGIATDPGVWEHSEAGEEQSEGSLGNPRRGNKALQDSFLMRNHYSK